MSLLHIFSMEGGRLYTGYHKLEIKNLLCVLFFSPKGDLTCIGQPRIFLSAGQLTESASKTVRPRHNTNCIHHQYTYNTFHPHKHYYHYNTSNIHHQYSHNTHHNAYNHYYHYNTFTATITSTLTMPTTTITTPTTTGSPSSTAPTPSLRLATPRDSDEEGMFLNGLFVFVKKKSLLLL